MLSGLLFAAGVLFPYLQRDKFAYLRALVLAVASAVSYWSAVWLALDGPIADKLLSFTVASIAGAAIVMSAALITSVRSSVAFVGFGLLAGFAGGPVTYFTLPSDGYLTVLGHVGWHTLICLTIYFGVRSRNLGADD